MLKMMLNAMRDEVFKFLSASMVVMGGSRACYIRAKRSDEDMGS
jgi:hypothetical protein